MKDAEEIRRSKSAKRSRRKEFDNEKRLLEKIRAYFPEARLGPPSGAKGGDFENVGKVQLEAKKLVSLPAGPEKALAQAERDAKAYVGVDVGAAILSDTASPGGRVEDRIYLRLEEFLEILAAGDVLAVEKIDERADDVDWSEEIRKFLEQTIESGVRRTIYGRGRDRVFHADFQIPLGVLEKIAESLGWDDDRIEETFSEKRRTLTP